MRSSAPLLLAFVVVLVASSGYNGIQARPLKYDALQRSTSRAARLYVSNTSAGLLGAESVDHSVSMHLQSDEDLLDQVAYRNPERWLVKVKRDGSSNCSEIISRICSELPASQTHTAFNGRCLWEASSLCFFTLEASSEHDLDTLLLDYEEHIDFAERDMKVIMEQSSGCAYPFPQTNAPWHLDRIDSSSMEQPLDNLFETPEDIFGEDVHIYILDTGIRDTHVEFAGRIGTGVNVLAGGSGSNFDDNGHGTAVASIAAGSTLGVCKCCKVHGIKCLDANGDGSYTDVVSALYWVLNNAQKPAIASLSLSGPTSQAINSVIHELYLNNILTIAAAGNENIDACTRSPGSSSYAVTVGASDRGEGNQDIRSGFSNYGSCVDLYAPGSSVQSAHFSGDQASSMRSGTSFSAPAVAGAAALYLQSYPGSSAAIQHQRIAEASTASPTIENGARLLNVRVLDICPSDVEPIQCRLTNWSDWGPACPSPNGSCGKPTQKRTRSILSEPSCGADVCPATQDVRYCPGNYAPCPSPFPTQWFGTNDQNTRPVPDLDLQGRTIRYEAVGSTGFSACIDDHTGYSPLEDFSQATKLDMGDDSYVEVDLGDSSSGGSLFPFLGSEKSAIYVGSNGYLTFDEGDFSYMVGEYSEHQEPRVLMASDRSSSASGGSSSNSSSSIIIKHSFAHIQESVERMLLNTNVEGHSGFVTSTAPHWLRQRVAGLFQDMDPSAPGDHGVYFQAKDQGSAASRLVITYDRVPLWGMAQETNTFQIVLYCSESSQPAAIKIWWGDISGVYRPLVGVSPGRFDQDQIESNLVPDLGTCNGLAMRAVPPAPVAQATPPPPPPPASGAMPFAMPGVFFSF